MNIQTRNNGEHFARIIYQHQVERANELCDEFAQYYWPMIGTANYTAYCAIDDAVDAMRECGMMRQMVKVRAQAALREYERYDANARRHFKTVGDNHYSLWADIVIRAAERLQPDVQKLYFAIKNKIDAGRCKNSVALAKIQTGVALVTLATLMYDTMEQQYQRKTMISIGASFRGGRLTAVEQNWKAVGELTGKCVMQDVDLRDDEACRLGVEVILQRYQSAAFINDAAGEALELNPEFKPK